jgi:multiple sugar transport system substrate-binding protein
MSKFLKLLSVLAIFALVLAACAPATPATEAPADETEAPVEETEAPVEETEAAATEAAGEPVEIRWYIGLGTGGSPEQVEQEQAIVDDFNAEHDDIELVMEVVENQQATNILATQIAAGEGPDIIGPTGILGLYNFQQNLLDITPLIESAGYSLDDFDPSMVEYYQFGPGGGQAGLPFAIFPSALWYNKDLFDEAGLAYPPHEYGAPYVTADGEELPWNIETMEMLATQLTVDANGNTADSPDFDPENIVQFGFDMQWTPGRGQAVLFGSGSLVDADGNAQIPDHWREFWVWFYDAVWVDHIVPNAAYSASDLLAQGNTFSSGNIAMMPQNLWFTCCAGEVNWDVAAIPEYNGVATAKLHADTFAILDQTENPEAAFEVLTYLVDERALDMLTIYGGFPAKLSLQEEFMNNRREAFPEVDFDVFLAGLDHIDVPNHEEGLPNLQAANERLNAFQTQYLSEEGLDINAEIDTLLEHKEKELLAV